MNKIMRQANTPYIIPKIKLEKKKVNFFFEGRKKVHSLASN